jgi:hypothetical protein
LHKKEEKESFINSQFPSMLNSYTKQLRREKNEKSFWHSNKNMHKKRL